MPQSITGWTVFAPGLMSSAMRLANKTTLICLLWAFLPATTFGAVPAKEKADCQIHLGYMADAQARDRVTVTDLVPYITALRTSFENTISSSKTPFAIDVVAMVKPNGRSRIWFVQHGPVPEDIDLTQLKAALEKAQSPHVRIGPMCFALMYSVNGGKRTDLAGNGPPQPPIPLEWEEVLQKAPQGKQLLEYFPLFWPDDEDDLAAMRARTTRVPDGFELQVLEPLGGKIARPKGWFFQQSSSPSGYLWTLSKDKSESGGFVVGMRIQMLAKVKEGTGMTPKEFVNNFITRFKPTTKVLSECPESEVGLFRRRCLEVEGEVDCGGRKEQCRDLYSFLWSDQIDMVTITIFGAPPDQWDELARIREVMSEFELIDMKRFDAKTDKPAAGK